MRCVLESMVSALFMAIGQNIEPTGREYEQNGRTTWNLCGRRNRSGHCDIDARAVFDAVRTAAQLNAARAATHAAANAFQPGLPERLRRRLRTRRNRLDHQSPARLSPLRDMATA